MANPKSLKLHSDALKLRVAEHLHKSKGLSQAEALEKAMDMEPKSMWAMLGRKPGGSPAKQVMRSGWTGTRGAIRKVAFAKAFEKVALSEKLLTRAANKALAKAREMHEYSRQLPKGSPERLAATKAGIKKLKQDGKFRDASLKKMTRRVLGGDN